MLRPYRGYGEEHDHELFLVEDGMLNEGVGEADKASATFFEKGG